MRRICYTHIYHWKSIWYTIRSLHISIPKGIEQRQPHANNNNECHTLKSTVKDILLSLIIIICYVLVLSLSPRVSIICTMNVILTRRNWMEKKFRREGPQLPRNLSLYLSDNIFIVVVWLFNWLRWCYSIKICISLLLYNSNWTRRAKNHQTVCFFFERTLLPVQKWDQNAHDDCSLKI